MQNFDYLKDIPELNPLWRYCDSAERHQIDDPEISAINARRALEWMARAIYQIKGVEIGERSSLFQIVDADTFRDFVADDRLMMAVHYIRKVGNAAAHDNRVSKSESFFALLRPHSTKYVKRRGGGFLREFRDALREQWGSIVTEGQREIHRKDAVATVTLTFVDEVGTLRVILLLNKLKRPGNKS